MEITILYLFIGIAVALLLCGLWILVLTPNENKAKDSPQFPGSHSNPSSIPIPGRLAAASEKLGLNRISNSQYNGIINGVPVTLKKDAVLVDLRIATGIPFRIKSGAKDGSFLLMKRVLIKEQEFDKKIVAICKSPHVVLSLLSGKTRNNLLDLEKYGNKIIITNKQILLRLQYFHEDYIGCQVRLVAAIANGLTRKSDSKPMLIDNMLHESVDSTRRVFLSSLMSTYPGDTAVEEALEELARSGSLTARMDAVKALGGRHMEEVTGFAATSDGMSAISDIVITELIDLMKETAYKGNVPALVEIYQRTSLEAVKFHILKALAFFGDDRACPFLQHELEHAENDFIGLLVEALGTCGTIGEVESLYAFGKGSLNPFTRNAVEKAIANIQSRLGHVEKGWLSVKEPGGTEGSLSMSSDVGEGALSMDEKDRKSGK
ncbi:MAG: HEAT repeat domain-containing protein [bacterium]|nr:HEAT repeat domain-containing protein [bacterium]